MVAGSVSTPRLDLANEDLVRAHIHAIWLAVSGLDLKKSLADLMDVAGQKPTLALNDSVIAALTDNNFRIATALHARNILNELAPELASCGWHTESWLKRVIDNIPYAFEQACERWRSLYRGALAQMEEQHRVMTDASLSHKVRDEAEKLYREAKNQRDFLLDSRNSLEADFYSYRYFASEGFLPGYNFPRLPLSAYIPGRRGVNRSDGYISRPRFLAISEFGPGSIIYHDGSRYAITRVNMGVQDNGGLAVSSLKLCESCGFVERDTGKDLCEMCGKKLPLPMRNLFRMRNVSTVRRERINSDEEERLRFGYQITGGYRFEMHGGKPACREAFLRDAAGNDLAILKYGHGATLWRINMGWLHRPSTSPPGFLLDRSRGAWVKEGAKNNERHEAAEDALASPETAGLVERVIPYVEDRKNCLVLEPATPLSVTEMVSLEAALKQAIQQLYQLEEYELSAETMPTRGEPRLLLFVESAEGGAGVLRHLVEDRDAMPQVAAAALKICHFDARGNDLGKAESADEECVAACYDCLMNYGNQRVHSDLNRHAIRDPLLAMAGGCMTVAERCQDPADQLARLKLEADSGLERSWLNFLAQRSLRLPDAAQFRLDECATVADFWYASERVAIYIDGPSHDFQDRQALDEQQAECLEDHGIEVIRFGQGEQWLAEIRRHARLFGYKGINLRKQEAAGNEI